MSQCVDREPFALLPNRRTSAEPRITPSGTFYHTAQSLLLHTISAVRIGRLIRWAANRGGAVKRLSIPCPKQKSSTVRPSRIWVLGVQAMKRYSQDADHSL
jgi:hypothetical protein